MRCVGIDDEGNEVLEFEVSCPACRKARWAGYSRGTYPRDSRCLECEEEARAAKRKNLPSPEEIRRSREAERRAFRFRHRVKLAAVLVSISLINLVLVLSMAGMVGFAVMKSFNKLQGREYDIAFGVAAAVGIALGFLSDRLMRYYKSLKKIDPDTCIIW